MLEIIALRNPSDWLFAFAIANTIRYFNIANLSYFTLRQAQGTEAAYPAFDENSACVGWIRSVYIPGMMEIIALRNPSDWRPMGGTVPTRTSHSMPACVFSPFD
jgi:hypothetical protein